MYFFTGLPQLSYRFYRFSKAPHNVNERSDSDKAISRKNN